MKKHLLKSLLALALVLISGNAWGASGTLVSSLSDITEGTYYIAALNGDKYHTVPNTTINGQTFTCLESSGSTDAISPASGSGEFVFTAVSGVDNAFYIYNTNLEKYLVATGSKTFGYVDNTSADYGYWTFSTVTSGGFSGAFSVKHSDKTQYMRAYNNSVRCYDGTSNSGVYLFLKSDAAATMVTIDASGIQNNLYLGNNAGTLTATVKVVESANVLSEAAVTWSSSDMTVATINETTGAVTLVAAGTTTITASYAGVSNQYAASSATYELTVENYNPATPGTAGTPYTVTQARAAIDAGTGITNVYVTGIISQVDSYSSQYKSITYWISEDGTTTNQFEVYSGKGIDGADFSAETDVKVGDEVVVFGSLQKYGETYEFSQNNHLVSTNHVNTPTFSLVAGNYNGEQNVTISCSTNDATIYYTLDGSDPTNSSTEYTGTLTLTNSVTLNAIAYKNGNSSNVASASYTIFIAVDHSPKSNYFTRVTDVSTLSEGDNIIFVYPTSSNSKAMGALSSTGNNFTAVGVIINGDVIESIGADVQRIVLQGSTDNWYFYTGDKYLYAASSSSNYLKLEETPDNNAKAKISMSGEETIIKFQGDYTHNYIKFNTSSNIFSCYASGQKNVTIFKEVPKVDVPITSAGWATAYLPFQAAVPTGVTAYIINGTTGENGLTLTEITGDIPANSGVLLKGAAGTVTFTPSSGTAADVSDNMLVGTADAGGKTFNETGMKYYILANDPDKYGLGFYFQTAGGSSATCAPYKAVLAVPAGSSSAIGFRLDGATMIDAVPAAAENAVIYDLTGRRVENPARGIYIVNGKKVLMK